MSESRFHKYRKYLEYLRNTGLLSVEHFDDDWQPIGGQIRRDMQRADLIDTDGNVISLSPRGEEMLDD